MNFEDNSLYNLLKQFDTSGPRYTSYPTAPNFSPECKSDCFAQDLKANNIGNTKPISIYIHIPFCDSLCYFCGCNTIITNNRKNIAEYVEMLKKEIDLTSKNILKDRKVVQIAWGGGTPSYLTSKEILDLSEFINNKFTIDDKAEISAELDPRDLSEEQIKAFIKGGANRFSIGVQDFNENVQKAVNRIQPYNTTLQTIKWIHNNNIHNINIDLIYGLPLQTTENFKITLEKTIELEPSRIAVFNFAYVPWIKKHQNLIDKNLMPSAEEKLQLLQLSVEMLTKAGYEYIGLDHFAKSNDELAVEQKNKKLNRNFQGYTTKPDADLFGFGITAISNFQNAYYQNTKDLKSYYECLNRHDFPKMLGCRLNIDDQIRKNVIMDLMCNMEVNKKNMSEKYNICFDDYFAKSLNKLKIFSDLSLIKIDNDKIIVSELGRFIVRNIAMCFDAYLEKNLEEKKIFSRTV